MTVNLNTGSNAQFINRNQQTTGFFKKESKESVLSKIGSNRFDTLDIKKSLKKFVESNNSTDTNFKKMISDIDNVSKTDKDDEKSSEIHSLHGEMQKWLNYEIKSEKSRMEHFKNLTDEKKYYSDLLDSSSSDEIIINDGQYDFRHIENGTSVSRKSIEGALACVQRSINANLGIKQPDYIDQNINNLEYVNTADNEHSFGTVRELAVKMYNSFAGKLSSLLKSEGISSSYLDETPSDGGLFDITSGRTEENFLEKSSERIKMLSEHSEGLKKVIKNYDDMQNLKNDTSDNGAIKSSDSLMSDIMRKKMSDAGLIIDLLA